MPSMKLQLSQGVVPVREALGDEQSGMGLAVQAGMKACGRRADRNDLNLDHHYAQPLLLHDR